MHIPKGRRDAGPLSVGVEREPRQIDFGLVIGVDHYPRFRPLQGAVADATRFHEWLCDGDGGGMDPQFARLVRSQPNPISPLQDEVDEKLVELIAAADGIGGGRRLYFHFSGHGAGSPNDEPDDVALLLAKWSRNLARLALSTDKYRGALDGMGLFEEIVISLDCCRTTAECAIGMPPTITLRPQSQRCATRCFIAYATERGRSALECPDNGLWQGVFTSCLLAILRHSPNGISAEALKLALECEVTAYGQQAHVVNGLKPGSMFGRRGVVPKLVVSFVHACGVVRLRNSHRVVIAEQTAGEEAWELPLEPGLYKLEDSGGLATTFDHGSEATTHVQL
jgi:hypothetical protein